MPAGLVILAFLAAPPLEGWWPPEGAQRHHPSALSNEVRTRVAAATVALGDNGSGVFVSRDGLVLTSATAVAGCVRRLRAQGILTSEPFFARSSEDAPICPGLKARLRLDVRDVKTAVDAARRAGSTRVEASLVSGCARVSRGRRCAIVSTEDGKQRLIAWRELEEVRLRYVPGKHLSNLGGPAHAFDRPRLRLDLALLTVNVGRSGSPGYLRTLSSLPEREDEVWMWHHPKRGLRWSSSLEVEIFLNDVLPGSLQRARNGEDPRGRAALNTLSAQATEALAAARRRELELFERLRSLPVGRRNHLASAFIEGRSRFRGAPWQPWTEASAHWTEVVNRLNEEPEDPAGALAAWTRGAARRREARLATGQPAVGPDGRGDLRVSRGVVTRRVFWLQALEVANRLNVQLELPTSTPWLKGEILGFEVAGDLGPLSTGGPVVNKQGELLGVVGSGDRATLTGFFEFDSRAEVSVTSVRALGLVLRKIYEVDATTLERPAR